MDFIDKNLILLNCKNIRELSLFILQLYIEGQVDDSMDKFYIMALEKIEELTK